MSVNPYLLFVCGINDAFSLNDSRFDESVRKQRENESETGWYAESNVPVLLDDDFDLVTGRYVKDEKINDRPQLCDLFYEASPMTGLREYDPIAGFIVADCYDRTLLRIFDLVGLSEHFKNTHIVVPTLDKESITYRQYQRQSEYYKTLSDKAIQENRLIEMYQPWQTEMWYKTALHVMHFAGWTGVTVDMLKLMLVFNWS